MKSTKNSTFSSSWYSPDGWTSIESTASTLALIEYLLRVSEIPVLVLLIRRLISSNPLKNSDKSRPSERLPLDVTNDVNSFLKSLRTKN